MAFLKKTLSMMRESKINKIFRTLWSWLSYRTRFVKPSLSKLINQISKFLAKTPAFTLEAASFFIVMLSQLFCLTIKSLSLTKKLLFKILSYLGKGAKKTGCLLSFIPKFWRCLPFYARSFMTSAFSLCVGIFIGYSASLIEQPPIITQSLDLSHVPGDSEDPTETALIGLSPNVQNTSTDDDSPDTATESTGPTEIMVQVGPGDTFDSLLVKQNIPYRSAHACAKALKKIFDPRKLRANQQIKLLFDSVSATQTDFIGLSFEISNDKEVVVEKGLGNTFTATKRDLTFAQDTFFVEGKVKTTLLNAALEADVPSGLIHKLVRVFKGSVHFGKDVRVGDKFSLLFTKKWDENTGKVRSYDLLHGALKTKAKTYQVYKYRAKSGYSRYLNEKAQPTERVGMCRPIGKARMSGKFGMRYHPVLKVRRMHKGIDYAAPTGSPIFAASNGVVNYVGWRGGYGRYMRIRHDGIYSTAYAHMSRFNKKLKKGSRVKRGQIIGYVGASGCASGPHLHYELLRHKRQINPNSIRTISLDALSGKTLNSFKNQLNTMKQKIDKCKNCPQFCENGADVKSVTLSQAT
jgi:murein DD-endopeptidase MepM/ murein hydrolase activator NlpD